MTRFSRFPLILLCTVFTGLALLLLMPLSVAASTMGLTARSVQGTILSGSLRDASFGRANIGDVLASLRILPLFTGRLGFALNRGDTPYNPGVSGTVGTGFGGLFAEKLTVQMDAGGLVRGMEGGTIGLEALSFEFSNGTCRSASGGVRINLDETALGAVIKGGMSGQASCQNGQLNFQLLSQSTMERAQVRLQGDGRYRLTLTITDPRPEMAEAMSFAGFKPIAGGVQLVRSGTLD